MFLRFSAVQSYFWHFKMLTNICCSMYTNKCINYVLSFLNFCDRRSSKFVKSLYQEWEGLEQDEVDEDEKKHLEEEVTYA